MSHHHHHHHPGPHGSAHSGERHARYFIHHDGGRGPWGGPHFGKGFGPFGPPDGREGFKGRFGRGDLKYVILDLLKDQPRHGYDVIRAMEERFGGFYSPSPGSVYPTLQMLDDQGYVTAQEQDGKRVFAITDAGRALLVEHAATLEGLQARMTEGWGPMANGDLHDLVQEVRQLGQFIFRQGAHGRLGDAERLRHLRDVVARARREIETIFDENTVNL